MFFKKIVIGLCLTGIGGWMTLEAASEESDISIPVAEIDLPPMGEDGEIVEMPEGPSLPADSADSADGEEGSELDLIGNSLDSSEELPEKEEETKEAVVPEESRPFEELGPATETNGLPEEEDAGLSVEGLFDTPPATEAEGTGLPTENPSMPGLSPATETAPGLPEENLPEENLSEIPRTLPPADTSNQVRPEGNAPATHRENATSGDTVLDRVLDSPGTEDLPLGTRKTSLDEALPKKSAAKELLETLVSLPKSPLGEVEALPLEDFLARWSGDEAGLLRGIAVYWEAAEKNSALAYWLKRQKLLRQWKASAAETALHQAALAHVETAIADATVSIRTTAMILGHWMDKPHEVQAQTLPHAGSYQTRYEEVEREGNATPEGSFLNRLIGLRHEQLMAAAGAYRSSEYVLQELLKQTAPLSAILQGMDQVNERRELFFDVLLEYNETILKYVLQVSYRRGAEMLPLLVVVPPKVPTENYVTPPARLPLSNPPAGESSSVLTPAEEPASTFETTPVPTLPPAESGIPVEVDPIPEVDFSESMEVVPDVPGGWGAAPVETPPPSSEFQSIGGETGSISTLPSIAPLPPPTPKSNDSGSRSRSSAKSPFRLVSESVLMSTSENRSGRSSEVEVLSLENLYSRVPLESRESATKIYWRYAVVQAQRLMLEHQRKIMNRLGEKILQQSGSWNPLAGLRLEEAVLGLRVELTALEIAAYEELWDLYALFSMRENFPSVLPIASTRPKSSDFQLHLDQLQAGSQSHQQAVNRARQLDYCVSQLSTIHPAMERLVLLLTPGEEAEMERLVGSLQEADCESFLQTLQQARLASAHYLRLVYAADFALTSAVFAGMPSTVSTEELIRRLTL